MRRDALGERRKPCRVVRLRRAAKQCILKLDRLNMARALLGVDDQHPAARIALTLGGEEGRGQFPLTGRRVG